MLSSVLRSKNGRKNKDTGSSIKNVEDDNREKMDGRFAPAQPVGWDTGMVCEVVVAQDGGEKLFSYWASWYSSCQAI